MSEYATQWVCVDCYVLLVNGDVSPDLSEEESAKLLSKFEDFRAMPGMGSNEHSEECRELLQSGDYQDCDCENDSYSTSACDGCGSPLHGERHAVTIEKSEPQHADYPHEPGTLYDCPACEENCYCSTEPGCTPCLHCSLQSDAEYI